MGLNIHILCNDGSPIGVTSKTIWGDANRIGVGGAELALLTMCEQWHLAGHEVILYNLLSPVPSDVSPFEQRLISQFDPKDKRDVLIVFRSPNSKAIVAKGLKVWWSTDQYTIGDFAKFSSYVDKIVCISEFHRNYFKQTYKIDNVIVIDLPVRVDDYKDKKISKIKNRVLFSSVPDRGLQYLHAMWFALKRKIPDLSLTITSDYRLWGSSRLNERHVLSWMKYDDVEFMGAISRAEFIEKELEAEWFIYPCIYDELFCISCAEAQVTGAYPITTANGALSTTNMGTLIAVDMNNSHNHRAFINNVVDTIGRGVDMAEVQRKAIERFSPKRILKQWDEKVFR